MKEMNIILRLRRKENVKIIYYKDKNKFRKLFNILNRIGRVMVPTNSSRNTQ